MRALIIICNIMFAFKFSQNAMASDHPRIQEIFLNKSTPQKIFLVPGLASSIKMPCEIDEVVTPTNGIMKHLSERNRSRFSLEVASGSRSTNFIVHCVASTYVFDVVVNRVIHNDYIEVIGDYGKPRLTQTPPRIEKPLLGFIKDEGHQSHQVIGTNSNGEKTVLSDWKDEESAVDYSKVQRLKIYESKEGRSDAP